MNADWIAADWGMTRLRAWAMSASGTVVAEAASSDSGAGALASDGFAAALDELVAGWECSGPAVVCGAVGARQGWVEVPYSIVPCPPLAADPIRAPGPREVYIVPGLKQDAPADVMHGEETQIAGFLTLNPGWDGVLCLPGTHTKWAEVSAGEVVSFRTFLTGELFALLTERSVLRHSVGQGWDEDAFAQALGDGMAQPERLAAHLFSIRAEDLLLGQDRDVARARLSGWLIGAELAAARPYWLGRQLAVIGTAPLSRRYVAALALQGVPALEAAGERMTVAGLIAAYRRLRGRPA